MQIVAPKSIIACAKSPVPARRIGWMSRAGAKLGAGLVCPIDNSRFRETGEGRLEPVET